MKKPTNVVSTTLGDMIGNSVYAGAKVHRRLRFCQVSITTRSQVIVDRS